MCKPKLKEIIPHYFSSKVQLLSKNSSTIMSLLQAFVSQQEHEHSVYNISISQCTAHGAAAPSLTSILLVCLHACFLKLTGEIQLPNSNTQEWVFCCLKRKSFNGVKYIFNLKKAIRSQQNILSSVVFGQATSWFFLLSGFTLTQFTTENTLPPQTISPC